MTWSKSINEWQLATFGDSATTERILERAAEEFDELEDASEQGSGKSNADIVTECADVVIVLCALSQRLGFDLAEAIEKKMAINRSRKWQRSADGGSYHIKGDGEAAP